MDLYQDSLQNTFLYPFGKVVGNKLITTIDADLYHQYYKKLTSKETYSKVSSKHFFYMDLEYVITVHEMSKQNGGERELFRRRGIEIEKDGKDGKYCLVRKRIEKLTDNEELFPFSKHYVCSEYKRTTIITKTFHEVEWNICFSYINKQHYSICFSALINNFNKDNETKSIKALLNYFNT